MYLESLVRKTDEIEPAAPAEEEIEDEPAVEEEVAEVIADEPEEVAAEEEVVTTAESVVEEPALEPIQEEVKEEPESVKPAKKEKPAKKSASHQEGETISVISIRIFNTPDPKGLFKIFTGNVIFKGFVNDMMYVQYVKPGFGLVNGYTNDLK